MLVLLLIVIIAVLGYFLVTFYRHDSQTFSQQTGYSYFDVFFKQEARTAKQVYTALAQNEETDQLYVNVMISGNLTKWADVIFVHPSGIYVIDFQIVTGWIAGRESDNDWWQLFHKNRQKSFPNPLLQSNENVRALHELLPEINVTAFKKLVVFTNDCSFQKIELHSSDIEVLKAHELKAWRKELKGQALTAAQMQTIKAALQPLASSKKLAQQSNPKVAI